MPTLLIGSRAILHHFPDFPRKPKDWDYWTDRVQQPSMSGGPDVFWDDRLHELMETRGIIRVASVDELYTMKVSHSSWELDNGSWRKHMHDIVWLKQRGAKLIPQWWEVLYPIWQDLHGKKKVNLNQESGAFFTDAVTRFYDHDSLHDTVAHYDRPLWMEVLADGQSVKMDMNKVWALPFDDQVKLFREEVYATALERWLVPAWTAGQDFSPTMAYLWALRKTITSLTKGKSSRFMIENYDIFRELPRTSGGNPWYIMRHMAHQHLLRPYEGKAMS